MKIKKSFYCLLCAALMAGCALPVREVRIPVREIDPLGPALRAAMQYQEQLRQLSPAELGREASRLAETPANPKTMLEMAFVHLQNRAPGDLARAAAQLENLGRDSSTEAQLYQPLARLLLGMLNEQRKLEDQIEHLAQQQRDQQREQQKEQQKKLDQLTEKLEALKAIERSLTSRPVAPTAGSKP
ncbi:hypothetical protein FNU76_05360 [Chitinimonas arctica]|uniref:Permease n=1 Tax=Chitinimonas arctica TaxID=2594795 RepID=A0A516SCF1_9NEIS|nr:hypothetical protein [Chitinimonas arctica]QDQ25825.1 hypothetical protein FNU76_05360 [Chitinimonas arctica]